MKVGMRGCLEDESRSLAVELALRLNKADEDAESAGSCQARFTSHLTTAGDPTANRALLSSARPVAAGVVRAGGDAGRAGACASATCAAWAQAALFSRRGRKETAGAKMREFHVARPLQGGRIPRSVRPTVRVYSLVLDQAVRLYRGGDVPSTLRRRDPWLAAGGWPAQG
jgi:hypothetical protein